MQLEKITPPLGTVRARKTTKILFYMHSMIEFPPAEVFSGDFHFVKVLKNPA